MDTFRLNLWKENFDKFFLFPSSRETRVRGFAAMRKFTPPSQLKRGGNSRGRGLLDGRFSIPVPVVICLCVSHFHQNVTGQELNNAYM